MTVYGQADSFCESLGPNGDACDEYWSFQEYGRLYNWYAVDDARGICPIGWHVPSDGEWMELEVFLGLRISDVANEWERGSSDLKIGTKLKSSNGWKPKRNGSNKTGFSVLPSGYRMPSGEFFGSGEMTLFWTATDERQNRYGRFAWHRRIAEDDAITRGSSSLNRGFCVRCIKD